jgi:cytochrome c oxidase subunit 2
LPIQGLRRAIIRVSTIGIQWVFTFEGPISGYMNHRSTGLGVLSFLGLALVFAVEPVAAQSITENLISELNQKLLYVALPITLFVEGILIYTVWRYRGNENPTPTEENRRLEITWTIATAIILLFVGVAAYQVLGSPFVSLTAGPGVGAGAAGFADPGGGETNVPMNLSENGSGAIAPSEPNAVEIEVIAYQWGWEFHYPNGKVSQSTLAVPTDRPVYLHITSRDVIHAVHVPQLGLKQDAIPGQYNTIKTQVTEAGQYQLYCAEFCGSGHSAMLATADAMPDEQYQQWLDEGQGSGGSGNATGGNATGGMNETGNSANVAGPVVASTA